MELNTISNTGTWGNSANRLNENFSKVNTEVEKLKNATTKNKGYFKTDALLKQTHQTAYYGDIAYVGTSYPYQIWTWNGTNWEDSKSTGGSETVNLGNYYTREDIDTQQHQQDDSLAAITEKQTEQEKKILSVEKTLENLEVAGVDVASADKLGGIKAETKTDAETAEAKIDPETGKLYVPAGGNNPDNEDLFLEKDENTQKEVMKFADKEYNAAGFSGLGRVYLRRNISVSKNVLTQDVMSKANTRYIIQYDYDLNGSTINIPENCILCFEGGSLKNGALNGNKTVIVSPPKKIFDKTLVLSGHFVGTAYVEYYGCYADIDSTDNDVCDAITALYKGFSDIKLLEGTYYTYKGGCRITSLSGQSKTTTIVHFHASKNEDYLFSMGYLDDLSNINYRERFLRLGNMRMIVEGSLASTRLEKCSGLLLGMIGNSEISNVRVDLFQENMKLSSVSEIKAAMESKDEEDKLNAAIRFIGYAELLKFDDIEPYGTIGIKAEGLLLDAISFRDCTIIGGSTGYASCLFNCQVMNVTFGGFNSWNQFTYGLKATNSVQGLYIDGIRTEQSVKVTDENDKVLSTTFYFNTTKDIRLGINNCHIDGSCNGFYFKANTLEADLSNIFHYVDTTGSGSQRKLLYALKIESGVQAGLITTRNVVLPTSDVILNGWGIIENQIINYYGDYRAARSITNATIAPRYTEARKAMTSYASNSILKKRWRSGITKPDASVKTYEIPDINTATWWAFDIVAATIEGMVIFIDSENNIVGHNAFKLSVNKTGKIGFVYKNEYTVDEERYFNMRLSTDSSDMWAHMVVLSQNNQVVFQNTSDRYSTKIIYEITLYSNKDNPLTQEVSWT